jgi:hypothetical protein
MSEAELHLIRSRLRGGLENKAPRGELRLSLPVGLDRDEAGQIQLSSDEQVRAAISRVYELWDRCSSARQIVAELTAEGQRLPRRTVGQRQIRWEPADFGAVHDFLTNPTYAGTFAFGRSREVKTVSVQGVVKVSTVKVPMEEWAVCIPDHHPGYVSWDQYLATKQRLRDNSLSVGNGGGAAREGSALLQGLVRCGKCGRKMMVHYSGRRGSLHRYSCSRTYLTQGTRRPCQSIGGRRLDSTVVEAFLQAVNPASVQATAHAIDQLQAEHDERVQLAQLALEQAEFEAGRRQRQFDACEPENRLVARTLEAALEQALADVDQRRRALEDLQRRQPAPLSDAERRSLRQLAGNLGSIWNAVTTVDQDRKQLLRALLDDVVLDVDREHSTGAVELLWQGGARTALVVRLNHSGLKRTSTPIDLIDLIRRLAQHSSDREIAVVLSKQGRETPTGLPFTAARVAGQLGVCTQTIRRWLAEGLLPAEQTTPHAPWRISLTNEVRERFVPVVPAGYLKLDQAARQLGVARQTVLNQVRAGHRQAVHVVEGKRRGLRIQVHADEQGQLTQSADAADRSLVDRSDALR